MVNRHVININTHKFITDLTKEISGLVEQWGGSGIVNVCSQHTTACVRVIENELLHIVDIRNALDYMFPKDKPNNGRYHHDLISLRHDVDLTERINGFSHMRSLLFNTSETIPVFNGKLDIGKWQSIVFVELDPTPVRERHIVIMGILE